jgi:ankyrin repeat protein
VVVPGITPLMYAARLANAEALRTLIGAGANLNTVNSSGQTALMFAAMGGNPESVRTILAAGARSDVKDSRGNLALTYATSAAADEKSNRSHRERLRVAGFPQPTPDFETIVELLKNTKPR